MSLDSQSFYEKRSDIVKAIDTIVAALDNTQHLPTEFINTQAPYLDKLLDNISSQIDLWMPKGKGQNNLRYERCARPRATATAIWIPDAKNGFRDPYLLQHVIPDLLVMIRTQIGRVRLRGVSDEFADALDLQAWDFDIKYQRLSEPSIIEYQLLQL
ncbi:hypothetical protein N7456_000540 [Penicillium angulare]|uniref:Uncharacterized protein n=1 Tax=Penicillium angulare TaxID=116970 RepID=A0A9W9KR12_9EURO|nr:hypothetical protein N7456_000540 [Penicillium angulare]